MWCEVVHRGLGNHEKLRTFKLLRRTQNENFNILPFVRAPHTRPFSLFGTHIFYSYYKFLVTKSQYIFKKMASPSWHDAKKGNTIPNGRYDCFEINETLFYRFWCLEGFFEEFCFMKAYLDAKTRPFFSVRHTIIYIFFTSTTFLLIWILKLTQFSLLGTHIFLLLRTTYRDTHAKFSVCCWTDRILLHWGSSMYNTKEKE